MLAVDPTARVAPSAVIGAGVEVGPYCVIGPHVAIGDLEFRGHQIHFLNFIGEPVPVAPAWCITDKELIVSLSPQTNQFDSFKIPSAP